MEAPVSHIDDSRGGSTVVLGEELVRKLEAYLVGSDAVFLALLENVLLGALLLEEPHRHIYRQPAEIQLALSKRVHRIERLYELEGEKAEALRRHLRYLPVGFRHKNAEFRGIQVSL